MRTVGRVLVERAIALYAQITETDRLSKLIDIFLHRRSSRGPIVWASTMYREFGPVIETPLFFTVALHETFLQSRPGTIKVFPAMPTGFEDMAFHRYLADGGVEVSARREGGETTFVEVKSRHGDAFDLHTDLVDPQVLPSSRKVAVASTGKGSFRIELPCGDSVILRRSPREALVITEAARRSGQPNAFGWNPRFLRDRAYIRAFRVEGR